MIHRLFITKTNLTPADEKVIINRPPNLFDEYIDELHISVTFTWDRKRAEFLAGQWKNNCSKVLVGGVAYGSPAEDFVVGKYLKQGCVITSRGCNNNCWFCSVPKREGCLRELVVQKGNIILDNNIIATSDEHWNKVIEMLKTVKEIQFTGGLEAKCTTFERLKEILSLNLKEAFFAYDTPDDLKPLQQVGEMLKELGYNKWSEKIRCYCLCGYKGDTHEKAERRMLQAWDCGLFPFAMVYRDENGKKPKDFVKFQRQWANVFITHSNLREYEEDKQFNFKRFY